MHWTMNRIALLSFGTVLLVVMGCGAEPYGGPMAAADKMAAPAATEAMPMDAEADAGVADVAAVATAIERKIIYTAEVHLLVEKFDGVPETVQTLAAEHHGYIARSGVQGEPGYSRYGNWTIRIPVAEYEAFLEATRGIGEVQRVDTDSRDVTEEYYDVEARIASKKKAEARLVELLTDATGHLDDVLKVEKELARVREEIERMEGRLRVLQDQTAFTTIDLYVREVERYEPKEATTFGSRIRRAWDGSWTGLKSFGQGLVIVVVALVPWLIPLGIIALLFYAFVRVLIRIGNRKRPRS